MAKLYNLARMTTATTGTGTITLGSAVSGYLSFAGAGISNGDVVSYGIKDGSNSETGTGTYTSSGTTLTRTVTKSTNSNSAISLSGSAQVFITPRAEDLLPMTETRTANTVLAGPTSGGAAAPTFRALVAADISSLLPGSTVQIATGTPTGVSSVDITNIPSTYSALFMDISGYSGTVSSTLRLYASTNNGSSFDTTSANYWDPVSFAGVNSFIGAGVNVAFSSTGDSRVLLFGYQGGCCLASAITKSGGSTASNVVQYLNYASSPINALRLAQSSGNFDAGTWTLYGVH